MLSSVLGLATGRNNIKKDHHLFHLAMNPDVQPAHIQPFDATTLREAFSLVPGTIPGFDNLIWTNDGDTGKKKVCRALTLFKCHAWCLAFRAELAWRRPRLTWDFP